MSPKKRTLMGNQSFTAAIALLGLVGGCEAKGASRATSTHSVSKGAHAAPTPAQQGNEPALGTPASALTLVTDRSLVCMVNDQFMGRAQIPIEADGRTYYGCCEMCKGRLANDPSSRVAADPVSGKTVDKATAVIGRDRDGRTLYFENALTFATYARRTSG
jgi:YHS domain-containing protein